MTLKMKQKLEAKFADEATIGIYQRDYTSGLSEAEFNVEYPGCEMEGVTCLPDGHEMFICTNSADYVVRTLGEGGRYGFMVDNNPSVTDHEILGAGGHDFAVIGNRYIVDLWISLYTGSETQVVYDMWDKKDHPKITSLYGDPTTWDYHDPINGVSFPAGSLPADKKISLGRKAPEMSLAR